VIVGSLFAGAGGFDLAAERAGLTVAWQVEIDPMARRVLEQHWPAVPRFVDVRDCGAHNLAPVDILCGGVPCQPFSSASAGKRRGTADDRHLWPQMRRIVAELRPAWVVLENVAQFDGPALEEVVSDLEGEAYEVAPPLEVPACAFGHDHRRNRLWVLGYTNRHGESGRPVHAEASGVPQPRGDAGGVGASDGVPNRVDRLRLMGNAIVPDIAEWIFRAILENREAA
jgi:DNA (cytosine-5)-methyltransferase 1